MTSGFSAGLSNLFAVDVNKMLLDNGFGVFLRVKRQKPKT